MQKKNIEVFPPFFVKRSREKLLSKLCTIHPTTSDRLNMTRFSVKAVWHDCTKLSASFPLSDTFSLSLSFSLSFTLSRTFAFTRLFSHTCYPTGWSARYHSSGNKDKKLKMQISSQHFLHFNKFFFHFDIQMQIRRCALIPHHDMD